jgi:flavin-dependent dehydrogenase
MYSHCYGQFFTGCRVTNHELADDVCLFLGGSERFGNGGGWCYPLGAGRISFGFASVTDSSAGAILWELVVSASALPQSLIRLGIH